MKVVDLNTVADTDKVVSEVADLFEKGEKQVHILGMNISQYVKNPEIMERGLDREEIEGYIKFIIDSSFEHDNITK